MLKLAVGLATLLLGLSAVAPALAQSCPTNRMITASGTDSPGSPSHIYYIFLESGEIQEGLNDPEPIKIECRSGTLVLHRKDPGGGKDCEFKFRYSGTNTGATLTETSPANCPSLQLTNLKWAAPVAGRLSEKKMVYALWSANDSAIRFTSLIVGIARDGGVRSLAEEMKTEHTDLNSKLATTFAELHVNWSESPAPVAIVSDVSKAITTAAEQKRSAMLKRASSKQLTEVDKQFVMDEYKFHTKMVKTIEKFKSTKIERLKTFLDNSAETFNRHIMHAEMLASAIGLSANQLAQMKRQAEAYPAP